MPAALRRLARVATAVSLIALLAPVPAFAGGGGKCNASACKVYTEGPGTAGGGGQQGPTPSSGSTSGPTTVTPAHVPSRTSRLLSHAGKDKAVLQAIVSAPDYGVKRANSLDRATAAGVAAPSALGAAFDLGAGPTILVAILLATVVALAVHGSLREWRRRRPTA